MSSAAPVAAPASSEADGNLRPADLAPGVGWLPPAVIQRTVRSHARRFRRCYEQGLRRNPVLKGKVIVAYVISPDGSVGGVGREEGTNLPDEEVVACVVDAFRSITFAQPEGGPVKVVYPLAFAPGD